MLCTMQQSVDINQVLALPNEYSEDAALLVQLIGLMIDHLSVLAITLCCRSQFTRRDNFAWVADHDQGVG